MVMSKLVHAVSGNIEPDSINRTMIHEHIVFDLSKIRGDSVSILGWSETLFAIEEELKRLLEHGFNTIVEQTNMGMGRDPERLLRISNETNMNIIAGTGYYKEGFYPAEVAALSKEQLAEKLSNDILVGMEGTHIRAGFYGEIGSSLNEITPLERKVFECVCDSHKETGAPISTHCEMGTMVVDQMAIFDSNGIDPSKVSFGHQDLNPDLSSQKEVLKWGAYIQYDTTGKNNYRSDDDRVKGILTLLDAGYEDRIMLSCDITRSTYLKAFGGHGYVSIYEKFIPMLKNNGVTDEIIEKMLVCNPRQFLAY